jgi:tetratricopeptide (TPR) repeat protein
MRWIYWTVVLCCLTCLAIAQQQDPDSTPPANQAPPRSDQEKARNAEAGESSSRDTRIDTSPPKDDAKHPNNGGGLNNDAADNGSDVSEMHPWNPYRAVKDDEVADYYFKQKNYKAALARYQDALANKEKDAIANFGMAECYEQLGQPDQAIVHYKEYLRILPNGPESKKAKKALEKLGEKQASAKTK